jgi:hypothetical protein
VWLLVCGLLLLWPSLPVAAHGTNTGPIQVFTQALGPYELAIALKLPVNAPATLFIDIVPQQAYANLTLQLRAAPRGFPFESQPATQVTIPDNQTDPVFTQVDLRQNGAWELEVLATGPAGQGVTQLPFVIEPTPLPPMTVGLLTITGVLALLLLSNIALGAIAQRQPLPAWLPTLMSRAMLVCLAVGVTLGIQQYAGLSVAAVPTSETSRPHVNLNLETNPVQPQVGQLTTLTFTLSDGGTGMVADDLVLHHEALIHLLLIDDQANILRHLHPARIEPGRYQVSFTPPVAGRYTAYTEIERRDSGIQVIERTFTVAGELPAPAEPPGLGPRTIDALNIDITANTDVIQAGKQTVFTLRFSVDDQPVRDVQPWLGMAGHLIARNDTKTIFGHIHAAEQMPTTGVLTDVRFGPDIRFVYTFPQPGIYDLWGQFRRGTNIITVPFRVSVQP